MNIFNVIVLNIMNIIFLTMLIQCHHIQHYEYHVINIYIQYYCAEYYKHHVLNIFNMIMLNLLNFTNIMFYYVEYNDIKYVQDVIFVKLSTMTLNMYML